MSESEGKNTEELTTEKNTTQPSIVAEDDLLTPEAASEVPFLSEDNPELQIFNDVLISMCEAFQFILLKCALTTYDESKIALETSSIDGGPSRITLEQKSKLQSVVDISIRNYITLYHLTSAFENVFRLFKRGIKSNFATLFVFLTLFCSVVSGTCPKYTEADMISGGLNFFDVLKKHDSCKDANTITVEEKIYIDNTDGPTQPPETADDNTKLAYNFAKEKFEATNTYQNLKNTRRLEGLLRLRAMEFLVSSNNMFARLSTVIEHKYKLASKTYVNKTLSDPLNPSKKETVLVPVFSAMTPTQAQIEEVKNRRKQQAYAQGIYSYDDLAIPTTKKKDVSIADRGLSDDDYLVLQTFRELFHLNFDASCKFVDEGRNSYSLCSYTLSGPSVDFDSPLLLLNTLSHDCLNGMKALGVTGLEGQNTQGKFFLKLMSVHSEDDRILELGDFYTTIQRIIDIPVKLNYLVTGSTRFKELARTMFANVLDNKPFEQIMGDTSVPEILDEGVGLSKDTKFESLVHKIQTNRRDVQAMNDALRDPVFLAKWIHEAGQMFNDIMKEIPMTENGYKFLNNTLTTAFQVANHLVLTSGNVSMTGIDKSAHFARIGFHIGAKSAEAGDRLTTTVYNTGNDMVAIFGEEAKKIEKNLLEKTGEVIVEYYKTAILFFFGLIMCYAGGPEKLITSGFGAIHAIQKGVKTSIKLYSEDDSPSKSASYANPQITRGDVTANPQIEDDTRAANQSSANPRLTVENAPGQPNRVELANHIPMSREEVLAQLQVQSPFSFLESEYKDIDRKITLRLRPAVVNGRAAEIMSGSSIFRGTVYKLENTNGGAKTRKHNKRIGAASKHHKKRRRGTKKPSKKRRATRRKRR